MAAGYIIWYPHEPNLEQWKMEAQRRNCQYIIVMLENYTSLYFPEFVVDRTHLDQILVKYALQDEESQKFLSVINIWSTPFDNELALNDETKKLLQMPILSQSRKRKRTTDKKNS